MGLTTLADEKKQPAPNAPWNHPVGPDMITVPADEHMLQAYSKVHGAKKAFQKAEAYAAGGVRWKEEVGPEVDKGGRKLATPARQGKHSNAQQARVIVTL